MVTVGEAARDTTPVEPRRLGVAVPDAHGLDADELDRAHRVAVVARAGERDHADAGRHGTSPGCRDSTSNALDQAVREHPVGGLVADPLGLGRVVDGELESKTLPRAHGLAG